MSRLLTSVFIVLCITLPYTQAAIPTVDFTGLFNQFVATGTNWCTSCQAFPPNCAMGCAGDSNGGGNCPANACPRVYTFTNTNGVPTWNLNVATAGSPYRAFSYIPLCTNAATCTDPFYFSFSVKYIPNAGAATPIFNNQQDYLKLLFWGDGNNILGVKNGQLLGLPNGGATDLPGTNGIGTNNAFNTPFPINTWTNIAVKITYANARATLAFFMNGQAIGTTTGSIGTSNSGLQFGAYVWGNTFFQMQYANLAITTAANGAAPPNPTMTGTGTATTAPAATTTTAPTAAPTTKAPTTAPATTATTAPTTKAPVTAATTAPTTKAPTTSTTTTAPTATPTAAATDTLTLVNPSTTIPQVGTFTVSVQYTAKAARVIAIDVLQPVHSYTKWGGGSAMVNAGSGTVQITVTMTGIAAAGPGYILQYSSVDPTKYQNGANPSAYATAFVLQTFSTSITGTLTPAPTVAPTDPATVAPTNPPVTPAVTNGFAQNSASSSSTINITSLLMLFISSYLMRLLL